MLQSMSQARVDCLFHIMTGTVPLLLGPGGIGKSQTAALIAQDWENAIGSPVTMLTTMLSQYDAFDVRGLGVPDIDKRCTTWLTPDWIPTQRNVGDKNVLWFLDELTNIDLPMQRVAMQLILDGEINGEKLGKNVRIMGAGNRRKDSRAAQALALPLLDRCAILEVECDPPSWRAIMELRGRHPALIAFHAFAPQLLLTEPTSPEDYTFATPRSVERCDKALQANLPTDQLRRVVSQNCGEAYATAFMDFYSMWRNLPSVADAFKNPTGAKVPERGDLRYAMAVGLARAITPETFSAAITYAGRLGVEYRATMIDDAIARDPALTDCKPYIDYAIAIARTGHVA